MLRMSTAPMMMAFLRRLRSKPFRLFIIAINSNSSIFFGQGRNSLSYYIIYPDLAQETQLGIFDGYNRLFSGKMSEENAALDIGAADG